MKKRIVFVLIVIGIVTFVFRDEVDKPLSVTELLDLGEKYLLEMNYEQAVVQFFKVIEIEPINPRGYMGAAEAYIALGVTDKAESVLRQGSTLLPDNKKIEVMIDELTAKSEAVSPKPSSENETLSHVDYEQLYIQYMDSDQWCGNEESEPLTITSYKIFDFDDNGIPDLWFYAESDNIGPRGPERSDFFCTIEKEAVKQLLSGYASGGTIGGDEIAVLYDTERQTHVICKTGYAGGFGGRASWVEAYDYSDGTLSEITKYFQMSQDADNYTESVLDGIHYPNDDGFEIAIYEVNDEQVSIEYYEEIAARFITAIDEKYLLSY